MLHLRLFDWILLLFALVVGIRFLMPDMPRSRFDIVVAATVALMALYLIALGLMTGVPQ